MDVLFCSKINLFNMGNKKGGDYSNTKIIQTLSKFCNVNLAVATEPFGNKQSKFISKAFIIPGLKISWPLIYIYFLNRKLKISHYDYVIAIKGTLLPAYAISKKFKIPLVIITRDLHELPLFGPINGKSYLYDVIKYILMHRSWRKVYEYASCVITSSDYLGSTLSSFYKIQKRATVYPLVNMTELKYHKIDIKANAPIGMISGSKYKGEETVLRLARRMPHRQFIIFNSTLKTTKLSNVSIRGYTHSKDIFSCISLLIVPSDVKESFGRVVIEALFNGVPCLAHDMGGLVESLGSPLLRVAYKDLNEWEEKIEKCLLDNKEYRLAYHETLQRSKDSFCSKSHYNSLYAVFNSHS